MADATRLDIEVLRSLFGDEHDAIREILETYLVDLDVNVTALREAAQRRDRVRYGRVAHSMKGASANVGAAGFAAICARAETEARGAEWAALDAIAEELHSVAGALATHVREQSGALGRF